MNHVTSYLFSGRQVPITFTLNLKEENMSSFLTLHFIKLYQKQTSGIDIYPKSIIYRQGSCGLPNLNKIFAYVYVSYRHATL